jgi:methylmalonyl-CoA mutase
MSAAIGGVDILHLQPYDAWSSNGASTFAYRMSNNISNILKEESFFDKVVDAAGGTYAIEQATDKLADSAWTFFQSIEEQGGFTPAQSLIHAEIKRIGQKRIDLLQRKQMKYIGITVFPNPDQSGLTWNVPFSSVLQPLILELNIEGGQG